MAIDLTLEKERSLSTQDMYDIIAFSTEAANDNGFMNSFIFNRSIYLRQLFFIQNRKKNLAILFLRILILLGISFSKRV